MEHGGRTTTRTQEHRHLLRRHRNEIGENISNVLKLYRCLRKTEKTKPRPLVFYDPGLSRDGSDGVVEAPILDRFAKAASRPYGRVGRARQHVGGRGGPE
jgi:hypothetical protein